jgi:hypothetical protein
MIEVAQDPKELAEKALKATPAKGAPAAAVKK